MVAARAREDEALAVRIMKARGYYDASAISTIDQRPDQPGRVSVTLSATPGHLYKLGAIAVKAGPTVPPDLRSEEHTSELQSLMRTSYAVFCLKKKKILSTPYSISSQAMAQT